MGVKFKALQMIFAMQKHWTNIYKALKLEK
jgi:hypothetical protein